MMALLEEKLKGVTEPEVVVNKLLDHCMKVTEVGRKWMEDNGGKKLSKDFAKYPGKMDHTTVVCVKVGKITPGTLRKNNSEERMSWAYKKTISLDNIGWKTPDKSSPNKIGTNRDRERSTSPNPEFAATLP
jgi:hypothetical protein